MNADWKIYFEKGRVDEQIRMLSKRFYNYKDQIINESNSLNIKIFNDRSTDFHPQFEGFLIISIKEGYLLYRQRTNTTFFLKN